MKNKIKFLSIFTASLLILSGCKKEDPVTIDTTPPALNITIQGGGQTFTFTHTDDYSLGQLNLKPETKYTINCVAADSGGIKLNQITLSKLLSAQNISGVPNKTVYDTPLNFSYRVNTTESDPYKSSLLFGDFVTPITGNGSTSFSISAYCKDFGNLRTDIGFTTNVESNPVGGFGWVSF